MMNEKLYTPKQSCELLGIHIRTLQSWDKKGLLKVVRTPSGRRRVPQSEIDRLLNQYSDVDVPHKKAIIYARVSSLEQKKKGDLDRQVGAILSKIETKKYVDVEILTDVGSGLNDERDGMVRLMELAVGGNIGTIFVTHKDRLTRFGFNYLSQYFKTHNVEIVALNDTTEKHCIQEELVDDLTSIINCFSVELCDARSYIKKPTKGDVKRILEGCLFQRK